ncbi:MAG: Ig-like domain-containing protein [Bacteroidales bacterium]|nr:Ig-like domain-containing protein [Bacteroidales bacterium]
MIPAESQAVFASGISFDSGGSGEYQTATVRFTVTDRWRTQIHEIVTKAPFWLAVNPSSGIGGDVEMLVIAEPNNTHYTRAASVTIICGPITKSFTVTQAGIPVEPKLTLDKSSVTLTEGERVTLNATVDPESLAAMAVSFESSDESVVTIDKNANRSCELVAVKEGSATITASYGSLKATCEVTVVKKVVEVTGITLDKEVLALVTGESETLTATVIPDDATDPTVTWSSSDERIATVKDGVVTGVAVGLATITATAGDKSATCAVTVSEAYIPVTEISLDKDKLEMTEGDTETLTATVKPDDATDKTVTWSSSDENIATVVDGKVTAVKEGTVTIAAKAGDKTATCAVVVNKKVIPVTKVTLDRTSLSLAPGETAELKATVEPDDATDKTVTWTSSDEAIATVVDGVVTAVTEGDVVITATAGDESATCDVTVSEPYIPVEELILDKTSLEIIKGDTEIITATVKPDDATEKKVEWSSADETIATVDKNGKVTGTGGGVTTVTASIGDLEATCTVTVTVPVESITLDKTSLTMKVGETATLKATVKPDDATDKTVTWSSADKSIATVDKTGKVTAVKEGETVITAKAGVKTASCKVTVNNYVFSIDPMAVKADGNGDAFGITVTCTGEYSLGEMSEWISEYSVSGTIHAFSVRFNPGKSERTGEVNFVDAKGTVLTCTVTQSGHTPNNNNGDNEDIDDGEDINW